MCGVWLWLKLSLADLHGFVAFGHRKSAFLSRIVDSKHGVDSKESQSIKRAFYALRLVPVVFYFLTLNVALFAVLGGFVGEHLKPVSPLKG
jgi:hypothetical protein